MLVTALEWIGNGANIACAMVCKQWIWICQITKNMLPCSIAQFLQHISQASEIQFRNIFDQSYYFWIQSPGHCVYKNQNVFNM